MKLQSGLFKSYLAKRKAHLLPQFLRWPWLIIYYMLLCCGNWFLCLIFPGAREFFLWRMHPLAIASLHFSWDQGSPYCGMVSWRAYGCLVFAVCSVARTNIAILCCAKVGQLM